MSGGYGQEERQKCAKSISGSSSTRQLPRRQRQQNPGVYTAFILGCHAERRNTKKGSQLEGPCCVLWRSQNQRNRKVYTIMAQ